MSAAFYELQANAADLDDDAYRKAHASYWENGFLVARGVIPTEKCNQVVTRFRNEIKTFEGPMLRQTTTRLERHNLSEQGFMTNPLLDVHCLKGMAFEPFRDVVRGTILHLNLLTTLTELMGESPVLVQSMYFESSRGTDPHTDSPFIDASKWGRLIGCWIALEDIHQDAGRFTVYPKSHHLDRPSVFSDGARKAAADFENHTLELVRGYQLESRQMSLNGITKSRRLLAKLLAESGMEAYAPVLCAGDVVFFSSNTLHGSHKPGATVQTRNSLTAHYIPRSMKLMRYRLMEEQLHLDRIGDAWLHTPDREVVSV